MDYNYDDDNYQYYQNGYTSNNQNSRYFSAYHANEPKPPPLQSLFIAIRSYIERKMLDSPHQVLIGLISTFLVIILFRNYNYEEADFDENERSTINILIIQCREVIFDIIESIWIFLSSIINLFSRIRMLLFSTPYDNVKHVDANSDTHQNIISDENSGRRFFERRDSMPPLTGDKIQKVKKNVEIEPAFLTDGEYPPGWLTFDPKHGLVVKQSIRKKKDNGDNNLGSRNFMEEEKKESGKPSN